MNIGVGQTGGTCWFNASLNMFLTSDNGLKILWKKLQASYRYFTKEDKEFFMSDIHAPCPYKGGVRKTRAIYFWKFLNQYMCAVGGPGQLLPKSGLNAYLVKNVRWRSPELRELKGVGRGALPAKELPALLTHLGFREGPEFRMLDFDRWKYQFKKPEWKTPILMYRKQDDSREWSWRIPLTDLLTEKQGYDLTGAIVYIMPAMHSDRPPHVWSCSIRNGKGYIIDSNYPHTPHECRWWNVENLKRFLGTIEVPYRPGNARIIGFETIMYTRREFTSKIAPSCKLPQNYRPLTEQNKHGVKNLMRVGGVMTSPARKEAGRQYPPRVIAEAVRQNAKRKLGTPSDYENLLKKATSFNSARHMLRAVPFRVNREGQNYKNFEKKLLAKFGTQMPQYMFNYLWKRRKSNENFAARVRSWAPKMGYFINEKRIAGILARRATTRAGTKRPAERMYRIGNTWFNTTGANVTGKVKSANWTPAKSYNKGQVNALARITNVNTNNIKVYQRAQPAH
jgi:hypothetical protein